MKGLKRGCKMKCPICNGAMVEKEKEYAFAAKGIAFRYFGCKKCKEELVFEEDVKKAFKAFAK